MLIHFGDFVSASLFAAGKSNKGYFAEVLHIHAGHMYGPLPTMGFAVLVSEYAAEEGVEVLEEKVSVPWVIHIIGVMFWMFFVTVLGIVVLGFAWGILLTIIENPLENLILIVVLGLGALFVALLLSIYVMALTRMIDVMREDKERGKVFQFIVISVAVVLTLSVI